MLTNAYTYLTRKTSRIVTIVVVLGLLGRAHAATRTWDDDSGDHLWDTAANWSSDTLPVGGDTVIIPDGYNGANSVNLNGTRDLAGPGAVGGTLTVGASTLTGGELLTNQFGTTVINATGTNFTTVGINNPGGGHPGVLNLTNSTYNHDNDVWNIQNSTPLQVNGGSFSMGNFGFMQILGYNGAATAQFSGGNHTVRYFVVNGYGGPTYPNDATLRIMNGAVVNTTSPMTQFGASGTGEGLATLDISDSSWILNFSTSAGVQFTSNSKLISSNAIIQMRGNFQNAITTDTAFDGDGLTVRMYGISGTPQTYEVAGSDTGPGPYVPLVNNFSIDMLSLGQNAGATLRLVNNSTNAGGTEALYTDALELVGDTTIELNGLHLYYRSMNFNGYSLTLYQTDNAGASTTITSASEPAMGSSVYSFSHIPEPATLTLVCLGAMYCGGRHRRKPV